jgi:hypothetical protein
MLKEFREHKEYQYIAYDTMDPIKILGAHQKNFRAFW